MEKKKTMVKEKTLNPVFNETFAFVVTYDRIRQASLVVSVMDYDRMGRNELIGQLVLGAKSGPIEMKHWNEMFAKPRQSVVQWHILKHLGWTCTPQSPAPRTHYVQTGSSLYRVGQKSKPLLIYLSINRIKNCQQSYFLWKSRPCCWIPCCLLTNSAVTSAVTNIRCHRLIVKVNN